MKQLHPPTPPDLPFTPTVAHVRHGIGRCSCSYEKHMSTRERNGFSHPPPRYTYCCSSSTCGLEVFIGWGWRNTCPRVNETASPTHPPDLPFTPTVAHVRHHDGIGNYTVRQSHLACPNGNLRGHEVPWGAPGGPQALEPAHTRTKTHMAVLTTIWDVA